MVGFDASISDTGVGSELFLDFLDHIHSGGSDGFHAEGREPVRKHGSEEESAENEGVDDVNVSDGEGKVGVGGSGEESSIEGEGNETGRSDGESFSDGGGGVSSSVEGIGSLSGLFSHFAHFSDSSSVVRDGSITIDGESERDVGEPH